MNIVAVTCQFMNCYIVKNLYCVFDELINNSTRCHLLSTCPGDIDIFR